MQQDDAGIVRFWAQPEGEDAAIHVDPTEVWYPTLGTTWIAFVGSPPIGWQHLFGMDIQLYPILEELIWDAPPT